YRRIPKTHWLMEVKCTAVVATFTTFTHCVGPVTLTGSVGKTSDRGAKTSLAPRTARPASIDSANVTRRGTPVALAAGCDASIAVIQVPVVQAHSVRVGVVFCERDLLENAAIAGVEFVNHAVGRMHAPDTRGIPRQAVRAAKMYRYLVDHVKIFRIHL